VTKAPSVGLIERLMHDAASDTMTYVEKQFRDIFIRTGLGSVRLF